MAIRDLELYKKGGEIFEEEYNKAVDERIETITDREAFDLYDGMLRNAASDAYEYALDLGRMDPAKAYFVVVEFYNDNEADEFYEDLVKYKYI